MDCTCVAAWLWDGCPVDRQLDVVYPGRQLHKCSESSSIFAWSLTIKMGDDRAFTPRTRSHLVGMPDSNHALILV